GIEDMREGLSVAQTGQWSNIYRHHEKRSSRRNRKDVLHGAMRDSGFRTHAWQLGFVLVIVSCGGAATPRGLGGAPDLGDAADAGADSVSVDAVATDIATVPRDTGRVADDALIDASTSSADSAANADASLDAGREGASGTTNEAGADVAADV